MWLRVDSVIVGRKPTRPDPQGRTARARSCRKETLLLDSDTQKFNLEDKVALGGNLCLCLLLVRKFGGDRQLASLAHLHAWQALFPSPDQRVAADPNVVWPFLARLESKSLPLSARAAHVVERSGGPIYTQARSLA